MTNSGVGSAVAAVLASVLALSACAADPTITSTPTPTLTQNVVPSPTPSPEPVAQAFGGDCGEMFAADELAEMFGDEVEIDPVQLARQRVGDEASVVSAGGIVCNWQFDAIRLASRTTKPSTQGRRDSVSSSFTP